MPKQHRASKVVWQSFAWPLAVQFALSAGIAAATPPMMKDAATHEQLALQLRKCQQEDPMDRLPHSRAEPPPKQAQDLLSQSDVLCFGGIATLVPKHAVLLLPKSMANRSKFTTGSTLMSWAEFYAKNRGWITTVEVSNEQAAGTQPLDAEVSHRLKDSIQVVVATYHGGPISVLSPKASPSAPAPSDPTEPSPSKH